MLETNFRYDLSLLSYPAQEYIKSIFNFVELNNPDQLEAIFESGLGIEIEQVYTTSGNIVRRPKVPTDDQKKIMEEALNHAIIYAAKNGFSKIVNILSVSSIHAAYEPSLFPPIFVDIDVYNNALTLVNNQATTPDLKSAQKKDGEKKVTERVIDILSHVHDVNSLLLLLASGPINNLDPLILVLLPTTISNTLDKMVNLLDERQAQDFQKPIQTLKEQVELRKIKKTQAVFAKISTLFKNPAVSNSKIELEAQIKKGHTLFIKLANKMQTMNEEDEIIRDVHRIF